jgi:hypothetical protein
VQTRLQLRDRTAVLDSRWRVNRRRLINHDLKSTDEMVPIWARSL